MNPLRLPIGIQSFELIRTEGCVHVDKTLQLGILPGGKILLSVATPTRSTESWESGVLASK
jgi:hypothetical protein